VQPVLSDDPALDDLRLKLAMHQRFECPVEGNGCEVSLSFGDSAKQPVIFTLPSRRWARPLGLRLTRKSAFQWPQRRSYPNVRQVLFRFSFRTRG
jgi:hypothetical protein